MKREKIFNIFDSISKQPHHEDIFMFECCKHINIKVEKHYNNNTFSRQHFFDMLGMEALIQENFISFLREYK